MSSVQELIDKLDTLIEQYGEQTFKQAVKSINRRRIDKNRDNRVSFSWREYGRLYKKQRGVCPICDKFLPLIKGQLHIDHINPNEKDFNNPSNRQVVHPGCNLSKSSKSIYGQSKTYGKTYKQILGGE